MKNALYFIAQKALGTGGLVFTLLSMLSGMAAVRDIVITLIVCALSVSMIFSEEIYNHFKDWYGDEEDDEEDL